MRNSLNNGESILNPMIELADQQLLCFLRVPVRRDVDNHPNPFLYRPSMIEPWHGPHRSMAPLPINVSQPILCHDRGALLDRPFPKLDYATAIFWMEGILPAASDPLFA